MTSKISQIGRHQSINHQNSAFEGRIRGQEIFSC